MYPRIVFTVGFAVGLKLDCGKSGFFRFLFADQFLDSF